MYIPASRNKTSTLHKRQSSSHKNHHNIDPSLTEKLKLKCEALSLELNRLKLIQYELIGWVKQLSLFAPRQIEKHLLKIIHNNNVQSNLSKDRSSPNILIHSKQRLKTQEIRSDQSSLDKGSNIKKNILKQIKDLRQLENKENLIRKTNQKHQQTRKSISKDNRQNNSPKYRGLKLFKNQQVSLPRHNYSKNNALYVQSSPKFRSPLTTLCTEVSSQESRSQVNFNFQGSKVKEETVLHCPNGHQYYRGQMNGQKFQGKGHLRNCCGLIPVKTSSKILEYKGGFLSGQFQGKGQLICKGDVRFQGQFRRGLRNGEGTIFLSGVGQRGIWQNDTLINFL